MMHSGTKVMAVVAVAFLTLGAGQAVAAKASAKKELAGVVNVNTATTQQLSLLPGVGAKAAKRIVDTRAQQPFKRVEDLRRVKGIGEKKLAKMRPYVALTGPTTAKLVKASGQATPAAAQGRSGPPKR